jgi:hypothetical protein
VQKSDASPDDFLKSLDPDVRETMLTLDGMIRAALPGHERVLWTGVFWGGTEQAIIGYGDLVMRRPKKPDVQWFHVGLARQKRYYSIYVSAVEDGKYLTARYAGRLGKVKLGAGRISFAKLSDIDTTELQALLRRAGELAGEPA